MRTRHAHRRGFTLVELKMTVVIGSLVILGVFGVFAATSTMERVFGTHFERSTELSITQRTIRRAMLSLSMESDPNAQDAEETTDERVRMLLEPDPTLAPQPNGWQPQRFEVVLSEPPIALNTMSNAALWARLDERDEESQDFSSTDASGGVMRSVFELRPDGQREQVMQRLGILSEGLDAPVSENPDRRGWTLWWRPILNSEAELLRAGYPVMRDDQGSAQEIGTRLAGAVRLARSIDTCLWRVFRGDEKVSGYAGYFQRDIPAYIEFDILLKNGQFATWMFEIDWIISKDPLEIAEDEDDAGAAGSDGDGDQDAPGGDDAQDPGGSRPGRPGPNNRPDPIRVNISEDNT